MVLAPQTQAVESLDDGRAIVRIATVVAAIDIEQRIRLVRTVAH